MKKLNSKGFTLVELLAVIVILVIIMGIALPNISSSIERSNDKKDKAMIKVFKSEAELYISKHKAAIIDRLPTEDSICYIDINDLVDEGYLSGEDVEGYTGSCLVYDGIDLTYYNSNCPPTTTTKCYG